MDEAKAREICTADAQDLGEYSHQELAEADKWVKDYAIHKLHVYLRRLCAGPAMTKYVKDMARNTYGSAETDEMLTACKCYPKWM